MNARVKARLGILRTTSATSSLQSPSKTSQRSATVVFSRRVRHAAASEASFSQTIILSNDLGACAAIIADPGNRLLERPLRAHTPAPPKRSTYTSPSGNARRPRWPNMAFVVISTYRYQKYSLSFVQCPASSQVGSPSGSLYFSQSSRHESMDRFMVVPRWSWHFAPVASIKLTTC